MKNGKLERNVVDNAVPPKAYNYFNTNFNLLKGYKNIIENDILTVFKNDKEVFKTSLPSSTTSTRYIINKYMIVQNKVVLPFDAKDFTYFDKNTNEKILVETSKVDLTNGTVTNK